MKRVLHLTLKKKWFDMILSGEKTEEYREIKPYWVTRLCDRHTGAMGGDMMDSHKVVAYTFKEYDIVRFTNGYGDAPYFEIECLSISTGMGFIHWGAELDKECIVISLGKVLSTSNHLTPEAVNNRLNG